MMKSTNHQLYFESASQQFVKIAQKLVFFIFTFITRITNYTCYNDNLQNVSPGGWGGDCVPTSFINTDWKQVLRKIKMLCFVNACMLYI